MSVCSNKLLQTAFAQLALPISQYLQAQALYEHDFFGSRNKYSNAISIGIALAAGEAN